jgi:hypothetical protein
MADYEQWIEFDEDFLPPWKGHKLEKTDYYSEIEYYRSPDFPSCISSKLAVERLVDSKYGTGELIVYGPSGKKYALVPKAEILIIFEKIKNELKEMIDLNTPSKKSWERSYNYACAFEEYVNSFPDDRLYKLVYFRWD